jgi:hypothetical protein
MSYEWKNMLKRWLHSHEEDSNTEMVFRPATFAFPASRGRAGFELKPDGSYIDLGIGPADGRTETEGEWSMEDDILTLAGDALPGGRRQLHVVSCSEDRLVIQK